MDIRAKLSALEAQVLEFQLQQDLLLDHLGVSDADSIIAMVESLDGQLRDLYSIHGDRPILDEAPLTQLVEHIRDLSTSLDRLYSEKSATLELDDGKPTLRATWKDKLDQGAQDEHGQPPS